MSTKKLFNTIIYTDYIREIDFAGPPSIHYASHDTIEDAHAEINRMASLHEGDPHDFRAFVEEAWVIGSKECVTAEKLRLEWMSGVVEQKRVDHDRMLSLPEDHSAKLPGPATADMLVCSKCGWVAQEHPSVPYPGYHGDTGKGDGCDGEVSRSVRPIIYTDPYGNVINGNGPLFDETVNTDNNPEKAV